MSLNESVYGNTPNKHIGMSADSVGMTLNGFISRLGVDGAAGPKKRLVSGPLAGQDPDPPALVRGMLSNMLPGKHAQRHP